MRVLTRWNILITCTNEGRLHGPVAGFNILSLPGPVERLTGNNNFFPQELRGVPVPKVVRTEIGVEAVLILYTQRQRQAREKEKQNGEHKQKTNTKSKTNFFYDFTAFGAGPACCRKPSARKTTTRKKKNCYIGEVHSLLCRRRP